MNCAVISDDVKVRSLANLLERHPMLFVQRDGILVGSVSNGDFRRGIAEGVSLEDGVERMMNRAPVTIHERDDYQKRLRQARRLPQGLRYLPEINDRFEILRIVSDKALISLPNVAVIMAGGLGSRLKTLTSSTPKPMLRIGDKPILQLIIEQFRRAGISRFVISVNYRAEVIKEHFKDGSEFDVRIEYLEETERMGTAGCLGLWGKTPEESFLVINGDILAELDPHALLLQHEQTGATATVCMHQHKVTIPYGVIHTRDQQVESIAEKPTATYNINAGIYVLAPRCLEWIPRGKFCDMPALLERILQRDLRVSAHTLGGFWIDIGNLDDFQRANQEFVNFEKHGLEGGSEGFATARQ